MMQRIRILIGYFLGRLFRSLTGTLYLMLTLAFWLVLFNPQQMTPDASYFILVAGVFGPAIAFLITLTLSGWANQAVNYPFIVRLPSRVEYLTAVLIAAFSATLVYQGLLALLSIIFGGPDLAISHLLLIPPVWFSLTLLAIILALHASDLVTRGWSRVYLFGLLAICLFGQGIRDDSYLRFLNNINRYAANQGWTAVTERATNAIANMNQGGTFQLARVLGFLFWPFRALSQAIVDGYFSPAEVLAPAIILIYAAILFALAADLFSSKDLGFAEG